MADDDSYPAGKLRWPVTIAQRVQVPDPASASIAESYTTVAIVHADVQPIGDLTFYGAQQVETPVTHRVVVRWLDYADTSHVVLRTTNRPDGSARTEVLRIRRVKERGGRKRFTELVCELEKTQ